MRKVQNRIKDGDLFVSRIVDKAQLEGGLFPFPDDVRTACLSLFCSFCLFGWNMERLGFGNMYVHAATFVIFCTARFDSNEETVRYNEERVVLGETKSGDCAQWLFCCCCSLAQEVRTADYYELMEDNLGKNRTNGRDKIEILSPLPREGGTVHEDRSNLDSNRFLDETDGVNQLFEAPYSIINAKR
ncbi:hypothetical protein SDJN02_03461, partial [Cucurbita argyrosperma subsp. argyrosperma]